MFPSRKFRISKWHAFKTLIYKTVNKVMFHWINRTCPVKTLLIVITVPNEVQKTRIVCQKKCLQNPCHKLGYRSSFTREDGKIIVLIIFQKIYNVNVKNQIFRNCFVMIHYHLTKVSPRINKSIIFEPNELSITQSTMMVSSCW